MDRSIERLSSGLRINSARDDAAGLAVSVRIDARVRGQNAALRNTNDAISYSQIGEGALSSVAGILQRMRELALQSVDESYDSADHRALNAEFVQLQAEIKQITTGTKFNGLSIFDGTARVFQIDDDGASASRITFQGKDLISDTSKTGFAAFINNGVSLAMVDDALNAYMAAGGTFSAADGSPTSGGNVDAMVAAFENNISAADLTTYNNKKTAFVSTGGSFNPADGSPAAAKSGTTSVIVNPGPNQIIQQVPVSTQTDINNYNNFLAARLDYFAAAKGIQILDSRSALAAIVSIDKASDEIDQEISKYGAFQNVLAGIVSNLDSSIMNQSAARSRITDADYAAETESLTRNRILQQAGMALLAQANQSPRVVLSLLQGNA